MPEHIPAYENANEPMVAIGNPVTPLIYFNRVKLVHGERYRYTLEGFESVIVPVTGHCTVTTAGHELTDIGGREHLWEGMPNGTYVPVGSECTIECTSESIELFIAGGRYDKVLDPFAIRDADIDIVQYGSDETKTHRKIKHILGQANAERRGRLLVSELFTVGEGGWSGFPPHKHDTERPPEETRFEEVYQFRFNPAQGFACQFDYLEDGGCGSPRHVRHGDTYQIDRGYHPSVVAPGYEMYYFTIIVGATSKSLIQYFEPTHAHQIETIPGIKDMVARFK